jgi:hypothetical protein
MTAQGPALARLTGWRLIAALTALVLAAPGTHAQPGAPIPPGSTPAPVGTRAVPVAPDVRTRDAAGHVVVRATRIDSPPRIDGVLDDEVYRTVLPITDFIQQNPDEGELSTEPTLVWLLFDDTTLYISARCHDSQPSRIVGTDMRRDGRNVSQNDNFAVVLDTFHDRRNGFEFLVNSVGGMWDSQITDERDANRDWNAVWVSRSRRDAEGWTVEMAIPFRSLRYRGEGPQVWGINLRRNVRWKNELSYLSPVPRQEGPRGILRLSQAATLVGLVAPPATSLNLDIKPYTVAALTTDRTVSPALINDPVGNVGFDVKYALTRGLTADFTYRTDFAQVEDDDLQVNLTRFNLFFPEKREFFLEGQGTYAFGGAQTTSTSGTGVPSNTPVMFFSRRIGLSDGDVVPMDVGGRVTGRAGRYTLGVLNVKTGENPDLAVPANTFSVMRVKRDIFRRSYVGVIGTHRSQSEVGTAGNAAFGVDTNLAFYQNLFVTGYYAETRTPGQVGTGRSHRGRLDYDNDRVGVQVERLAVGRGFNPEVGFMRRADFVQHFGQFRLSHRPASLAAIRRMSVESSLDYITDNDLRLQNRTSRVLVRTEMENSDAWLVQHTADFEWVDRPFRVVGAMIPAGVYRFSNTRASYTFGTQRRISGEVGAGRGEFYGGERTDISMRTRADLSKHLSLEPSVTINRIDLPAGRFIATLASSRAIVSFNPRMIIAALVQYNSSANFFTTNIRYRWEFNPASELFVVYSDGRDTALVPGRQSALINRGFTIKVTRLFQM